VSPAAGRDHSLRLLLRASACTVFYILCVRWPTLQVSIAKWLDPLGKHFNSSALSVLIARSVCGSGLSAARNLANRNSLTRGSKQRFESVFGGRLIPYERAESLAKDLRRTKAECEAFEPSTQLGHRLQVSGIKISWPAERSTAPPPRRVMRRPLRPRTITCSLLPAPRLRTPHHRIGRRCR
jgi:hypothetical protein